MCGWRRIDVGRTCLPEPEVDLEIEAEEFAIGCVGEGEDADREAGGP